MDIRAAVFGLVLVTSIALSWSSFALAEGDAGALAKAPTEGGWIWGAGAIAQLDTASDDRLGQGA